MAWFRYWKNSYRLPINRFGQIDWDLVAARVLRVPPTKVTVQRPETVVLVGGYQLANAH